MTAPAKTAVAARLALLAILALALLDPPVPAPLRHLPGPQATPVDLVLLQEDSPHAHPYWTPTLRAAISGHPSSAPASLDSGHPSSSSWTPTFAAELVRTLEALPAGSRVAALRFGDASGVLFGLTSVEQAPLGRLFAPSSAGGPEAPVAGTSLGAAIDTALHLGEPGRRLGVVVVAHGDFASAGAAGALARARSAGVAVYWRDLRREPAPPGLRVVDMHAPRQVRSGEALPVSVALAGGGRGTLQLWVDGRLEREQEVEAGAPAGWRLPSLPAGAHLLQARVMAGPGTSGGGDPGRVILVRVAAPPGALYVSREPAPPLLRSLRGGDWPVVSTSPARLLDGLDESPAVVILDDVPLAALSTTALDKLARRVRAQGAGLLVLGGSASFAAGGYRDSLLEELLPVTVKGGRPGGAAAVLFLVDTSGSMGRDARGDSREGRARQAVVEAAASLAPGDLSGVYTYDRSVRRTLPLAPRARPAAELRAALRSAGASGGTRLAPALAVALADLARADAAQKILVLVTDGHLGPTGDLTRAETLIAASQIQVIPVVIGGRTAVAPLHRLARAGGGTVLRVDRVTELPRLLREAIDETAQAPPDTPLRPLQTATLPLFARVSAWPALRAFQMTRERPTATVYLRAPGGAPLLAAHQAGAGRVLVLPAGLSAWAPEWAAWDRFGELAAALVQQVAAPHHHPHLQLRVVDSPGAVTLRVDAREALADPITAMLAPLPARAAAVPREVTLEALAPGRHGTTVTGLRSGVLALTLRAGDEALRAQHLHRVARDPATQVLAPALAAGSLRRFEAGEVQWRGPASAQALLIAVAATGYLALIAAPWLAGVARRAIRARGARTG